MMSLACASLFAWMVPITSPSSRTCHFLASIRIGSEPLTGFSLVLSFVLIFSLCFSFSLRFGLSPSDRGERCRAARGVIFRGDPKSPRRKRALEAKGRDEREENENEDAGNDNSGKGGRPAADRISRQLLRATSELTWRDDDVAGIKRCGGPGVVKLSSEAS